MAVPSNRVPVRVARGLKSALTANLADLLEGELLYAKDEDKLYMVEGGALVAMGADLAASSIGDLSDVTLTSAAAGEVLRYNGSAWVDAQLGYSDLSGTPTLGTAAAASTTDFATAAQGALADSAVQPTDSVSTLADVTVSSPSNGEALVWNGSAWVNSTVSTVGSIDDLTDVDTTTAAPTTGQVLEWDGTNWVPATPAAGGVTSVNSQAGVVVLDLNDLDDVSAGAASPDRTYSGGTSEGSAGGFNFGGGYFWLNNTDSNGDSTVVGSFPQGTSGTVWISTNGDPILAVPYSNLVQASNFVQLQYDSATYVFTKATPCLVYFTDPALATPTDGQVLTWVAANSQWEAADPAAGGGLSGIGVATRVSDSGTAASSALTLTGLGSSGQLHTLSTDLDAWVVFYGSAADRTADAGRSYNTDPAAGSGVLAEAYVTTAGAILFTPGTGYMNNDTTETAALYLAVRDQAGAAVNATLTVTAYVQGGYTGVSGGTFGSG